MCFSVNGEFISILDLSDADGAVDIAAITGAFTGNEVAGAVTRFEGFTVSEFRRQYGPASGELEHQEGFISQHRSGVWNRDLVVEAEFISPTGSDWDYGFIIRRAETDRLEVIGINGIGWWFHNTHDVGDSGYTNIAEGRLGDSGITLQSRNLLLLIAFDDLGIFFVNGKLVARLDLSHNLDYGSVSVMGGFFNSHTGEPSFENFNVWTP